MSEVSVAAVFIWGLCLGMFAMASWQRRDARRFNSPPPEPLTAASPAGRALIDALQRHASAEMWAPPGSGFEAEGVSYITFHGEPFVVTVKRGKAPAHVG